MPLNATSAVILGLLHEGAATGGDAVAAADRRLVAQGGVTRSQVYRELPLLARDGLIHALAGANGRGGQAYAITAAGRQAFASWATAPAGTDTVRSAAVLRLGFGAHLTPADRRQIVAAALAKHELALAEHVRRAADLRAEGDEFAGAAAEFAVAYEQALLTWLRGFPS